MAALTSSGVTVNEVWKEGGTSGRKYLAKDVTLVLSSQGGVTNNIPATLFGMTKITGVRGARKSDGTGLRAWPSYDGTLLLVSSPESATAQTAADLSATVRLTVVGLDA